MKCIIGTDIGGTNIKFVTVSQTKNILSEYTIPTPKPSTPESVIKAITTTISSILPDSAELCGIGIGVPGLVNSSKGLIYQAGNLNWTNVSLMEPIALNFKTPVAVENDGVINLLGEHTFGSTKGCSNVILLTLGTGLGGGIIVNGIPVHRENGLAPEVGHTVIDSNGFQCSCGRRGCFESACNSSALIRYAKQFIADNPDSLMLKMTNRNENLLEGEIVSEAYAKGDKAAIQTIKLYTKKLSEGILNLINIFNPELIILSGGIANAGNILLDNLNPEVSKHLIHPIQQCKIITAQLGYYAGANGAAALIAQKLDFFL